MVQLLLANAREPLLMALSQCAVTLAVLLCFIYSSAHTVQCRHFDLSLHLWWNSYGWWRGSLEILSV